MCEPVLMSKKSFDSSSKTPSWPPAKGAGLLREQSRCREQRGDKTFEDQRIPIITAARSASTSALLTPLRRRSDRHRHAGNDPYVLCMMLAIVILCFFAEIATWLQDHLMDRGG
jgi:hypothetical protein